MVWNNSMPVQSLYDQILKNWWSVDINSNQSSMWSSQFISDYNDTGYFDNEIAKQDQKINELQWQSKTYLTWNSVADSVITTPQSQWSSEQQAVAQLNPQLKQLNAWYLNNIAKIQSLQNEKVSLAEARQMMEDAYQKAINATNKSANDMMAANMANANIQAGWAISSSRWLSTNPAAAAATRMSAQNQAAIQNASVRSQANQNLANIYGNMANMPSVLSSIASSNTNADIARLQAEWQALANYKDLTTTNQSSNWWYSYSSWWSNWWGWSSWWWGGWWWSNYTYWTIDEYLDWYDKLTDNQKKYYDIFIQNIAKEMWLWEVKHWTKDFDAAVTLIKKEIADNYNVAIDKDWVASLTKTKKDDKEDDKEKTEKEEEKKEDNDTKTATWTNLTIW